MRATCEKLERAAPETDRFAMLIRDTVDREVRIAALGALWEVALADGADDPAETAVIDAARHAMGLTEAETAAARSLAAGGAQ